MSQETQVSNEKIIYEVTEYTGDYIDFVYFLEIVTHSEGNSYINYKIDFEKLKKFETIEILKPEKSEMSEILEKKFSSSFNIFVFTKIK